MIEVAIDNKRGRVLVASRNIEIGENVIVEEAFTYSTHLFNESCSICLKRLSDDHKHCVNCNSLFCSSDCQCKHDDLLCSSLSQLKSISDVVQIDLGLVCLIFQACVNAQRRLVADKFHEQILKMVRSLHGIAESDADYTLFDLVCSLQTHREDIDPEHLFTFKKCAKELNSVLVELFNCEQQMLFNEELIVDLFCITFVNAHGLCPPGFSSDIGTGLFPVVSLISHDCYPNCCFVTIGHTIYVRSIREIQKGEELSISYIDLMPPTHLRRRVLLQSKYFICECNRCKSPSENGRYLRAFKCSSCDAGYRIPVYACDDEQYTNSQEDNEERTMDDEMLESGDVTYDEAFEAFDNIYGEEPETDFDRVQNVTEWTCSHCDTQSKEDYTVIEKEFTAEMETSQTQSGLAQLQSRHAQLLHRNHHLLFNLRIRQLIVDEQGTDLLSPSELTECIENVIQIATSTLPRYHVEIAELNMRYYKYCQSRLGNNSGLPRNLLHVVAEQYRVLYPPIHHAHSTLEEQ